MIKICINSEQCGVVAHNCPKSTTRCHNCNFGLVAINEETYLKKFAAGSFFQYDYGINDYESGTEVTPQQMGYDMGSAQPIKKRFKNPAKEKNLLSKKTIKMKNSMQLDLVLTSTQKLATQYDLMIAEMEERIKQMATVRDQLNNEVIDANKLQTTEIMHIDEILNEIFSDCPVGINPQKHRYNNGTLGHNSKIRIAEEYGKNVKCVILCIPENGSTFDGSDII